MLVCSAGLHKTNCCSLKPMLIHYHVLVRRTQLAVKNKNKNITCTLHLEVCGGTLGVRRYVEETKLVPGINASSAAAKRRRYLPVRHFPVQTDRKNRRRFGRKEGQGKITAETFCSVERKPLKKMQKQIKKKQQNAVAVVQCGILNSVAKRGYMLCKVPM